MKKLKRDDIIKVLWVDQSSYTGPAPAEGAIQKAFGQDVGHFLEEDKDWLCIGTEKFATDVVMYRHIMTFPKVCITKIEVLERGSKKL